MFFIAPSLFLLAFQECEWSHCSFTCKKFLATTTFDISATSQVFNDSIVFICQNQSVILFSYQNFRFLILSIERYQILWIVSIWSIHSSLSFNSVLGSNGAWNGKVNNLMCTLCNIILWEMFLTLTWEYTQKPCELKSWLVSLKTKTCTLCVIGTP